MDVDPTRPPLSFIHQIPPTHCLDLPPNRCATHVFFLRDSILSVFLAWDGIRTTENKKMENELF